MTPIKTAAMRAHTWLERAVPLWLDRGVDRVDGGFHEMLDLADAKRVADYKRVRVISRQIYVFAAASRLGHAGAVEAIRHGLDFLLGPCRHPEGGFVTRVDQAGLPLDPRRELYEQAFVLFALGHAYRVLGEPAIRDEAHVLWALLRDRMRHPHGGYREALEPAALPRRQNPHMHLLEAALVWAVIEPTGPWRVLVQELTDLFVTCFRDPSSGALLEYLNEALEPWAVPQGSITEPGHHFEWVWLLHRSATVGGSDPQGADALYAFAHRFGFARSGLLHAEVSTKGVPLTRQTRVWPHTEWLKAECVMGGERAQDRVLTSWTTLERMLNTAVRGLWLENWDTDTGEPRLGPVPASTFYHIMLAIEVLLAAAGCHPDPFGVA